MEAILGLAIFYAWVHAVIIIGSKTVDTTAYEKGVLIAGACGFVLYVMGTIGSV